MHPKSTLREALEPTWTALGQNIKKKRPRQHFPRVTFGVHFEAFLSPGVHQGSPDLKKYDFLGDSFLDHFFASTRAPQNVLGSVLATVSARFSQVQ